MMVSVVDLEIRRLLKPQAPSIARACRNAGGRALCARTLAWRNPRLAQCIRIYLAHQRISLYLARKFDIAPARRISSFLLLQ
jgi:hypothetical protein